MKNRKCPNCQAYFQIRKLSSIETQAFGNQKITSDVACDCKQKNFGTFEKFWAHIKSCHSNIYQCEKCQYKSPLPTYDVLHNVINPDLKILRRCNTINVTCSSCKESMSEKHNRTHACEKRMNQVEKQFSIELKERYKRLEEENLKLLGEVVDLKKKQNISGIHIVLNNDSLSYY